jgi:hypothetical protein
MVQVIVQIACSNHNGGSELIWIIAKEFPGVLVISDFSEYKSEKDIISRIGKENAVIIGLPFFDEKPITLTRHVYKLPFELMVEKIHAVIESNYIAKFNRNIHSIAGEIIKSHSDGIKFNDTDIWWEHVDEMEALFNVKNIIQTVKNFEKQLGGYKQIKIDKVIPILRKLLA